jgi:2-hydroxychromene-2-carboxylate isomerase
MMTVTVEFLFDLGSPNAYLAHRLIPDVERRTGARFEYVPILLGGVFKATNNVPPLVAMQGIRNKTEYTRLEMRRFVEKHGLAEFAFNPHFPVNTLRIMRGAIAAQDLGVYERYVDAAFRHMWEQSRKMDDPDVMRAAFAEAELPVDALVAGMEEPSVKQRLIDNTEQAVVRGVFGAPSFFVGDELYFGKDRLRDVEEQILAIKSGA